MTLKGLSVRAANAVYNMDIRTKREVLRALKSGELHPSNHRTRNYGWKTHCEVSVWAGLPNPDESVPAGVAEWWKAHVAEDQLRKAKRLLALALSELEHCATLVNDHGRPGAVIKQIKEGK